MYPVKLITVEKSRDLETKANKGGLSFAEMMENAGRGTAAAIDRRIGAKDKQAVILVGPGNNGGDGLVAAYYLWEIGMRVTCYIWKRTADGDANLQRVEEEGVPIIWAEDDEGWEALRGLLSSADVLVDAVLGVGISLPIRENLRDMLDAVRQILSQRSSPHHLAFVVPPAPATGNNGLHKAARPLIVAVDCPTGLDCDSGELDPAALHADLTVTFAYPKVGLLRFPGAEAVGEIVTVDIAIPPDLAADIDLEMATSDRIRAWLPERLGSSHKGTFGSALLVTGSINFVGAAILSGTAATRAGAGLVTMALPGPIQPAVSAHLTEATYLLLPHDMGVTSSGAVKVLQEKMGDYDALLVGCGLSQEDETVAFVHNLLGLKRAERKGHIGFVLAAKEEEPEEKALPPLVVDADGLNALSRAQQWWKSLPADTILTPHPGEMARLMGGETTIQDIQADREGIARRMAAEWDTVLVLKGAFTVVAAPDGRLIVLPFANPGLATAGTGDVLAGTIVGLRAQGMDAFEAAVAGAYLHALAGELARADLGDMGMVAGDLLLRLPMALRRVRSGE